MSPMTTVCWPMRLKEAHDVSPIGGVMRTPATLTSRSPRGTETLKAPSLSSSLPFSPVSSSIRPVLSWGWLATGSPAALVTAAIRINAGANWILFMLPPLVRLRNIHQSRSAVLDHPHGRRGSEIPGSCLLGDPPRRAVVVRHGSDMVQHVAALESLDQDLERVVGVRHHVGSQPGRRV